jgi:hypothetical protein
VAGAQGIQGVNAYTTATAAFTVPPIGSTVVVSVANASWMVIGEMVWIASAGGGGQAGQMQVQTVAGNSVTLLNVSLGGSVPGTNVPNGAAISPGGEVGPTGAPGVTGAQGPAGPSAVSTDAGNQATLGSDKLVYVPDPTPVITSVRLRSYNSVGNPNFEVDQRNAGTNVAYAAGNQNIFQIDRWKIYKAAATGTINVQQVAGNINVPGTSFAISANYLNLAVSTTQATLAASEAVWVQQSIEGPFLRELINDVHSLSILAYCTSAISFAVSLTSATGAYSYLPSLLNLPANAWTLFTIPNIPVWAAGGTWLVAPGNIGYSIRICLGAGSTLQAPSTGSWIAGNYLAPAGCTNLLSLSGAVFRLAFIQHEPGPQATTLIDCPFSGPNGNLQACQRYYQKSNIYTDQPGKVTSIPVVCTVAAAQNPLQQHWFKQTMAKIPTVTLYNYSTGAVNSIRDMGASVDRAVSSVGQISDSGFGVINLTTQNAAATWYAYNYTADTGW